MAAVTGMGGDVTLGSTALKVQNWSLDISADKLKTTNAASGGWQEYVLGPKGAEGSFDGVWIDDINSSNPPHALIVPQTGVSFALDCGTTGGDYAFTGVITKMSIKSASDGLITYSCDFTAVGAVTFNNPA